MQFQRLEIQPMSAPPIPLHFFLGQPDRRGFCDRTQVDWDRVLGVSSARIVERGPLASAPHLPLCSQLAQLKRHKDLVNEQPNKSYTTNHFNTVSISTKNSLRSKIPYEATVPELYLQFSSISSILGLFFFFCSILSVSALMVSKTVSATSCCHRSETTSGKFLYSS